MGGEGPLQNSAGAAARKGQAAAHVTAHSGALKGRWRGRPHEAGRCAAPQTPGGRVLPPSTQPGGGGPQRWQTGARHCSSRRMGGRCGMQSASGAVRVGTGCTTATSQPLRSRLQVDLLKHTQHACQHACHQTACCTLSCTARCMALSCCKWHRTWHGTHPIATQADSESTPPPRRSRQASGSSATFAMYTSRSAGTCSANRSCGGGRGHGAAQMSLQRDSSLKHDRAGPVDANSSPTPACNTTQQQPLPLPARSPAA